MIRRAWTLCVGYMITYCTFSSTYRNNSSVTKFFPQEKFPYLFIGYLFFLYGLTAASTWIILQFSQLLNYYLDNDKKEDDVFEHDVWKGFEVLWWYFVGNFSVLAWAVIGEFYEGQHRKMFAFGVFFAIGAEYVGGQLQP
ncbi:hypothetical protein Fcan01_04374 [Folsomia candida]|uniref:Uncharacterized protein n=1 Tax=Folsomia candida TaxID=158441 RepID=A0A226ET51_FOLCA|nr:hypothetical protein Fcan01_04374 [Folsomia candida]